MEKQSNVERLSGYIILIGVMAIAGALCWYFRSVLMYIILAFVVSLVSRPLVSLMRKVRVKGKSAPDWLLAILSIFFVIAGLSLVVTQAIPVVVNIIREAAVFNDMNLSGSDISDTVNSWVVGLFPSLGPDYDAISVILDYLKNATSGFSITGLLGSVAGAVVNLAVGLFAVVFISFFFVKDDKLFSRIVAALVPDPIEGKVTDAIGDIERLLSRYFVGLLLEMLCVAFFNFLGLSLIARIGANYALGIAFIAGILNIIPYVGPIIGEVLGVLLCLVLKYGAGVGLDVNIWIFALIVLAIMLGVQLIDNFVLQPLIYSTSIQASPLEIFIVMLMAGHLGGIVGMLAAIPGYTIIRVVAGRFFYDKKIVRRLMPDLEKEVKA
ncbi:MAG: AI-2E family transporter [Bacteroidales bacterium]|nr:AI-2E family transporter [Bacteroidales bacterium]MBR6875695.1 AI-2E family transporter [Bacteroidales bacterium]